MRILLILVLLVPVILFKAKSQEPADGPPNLQVGDVSVSRFRTYEQTSNISNKNINKSDPKSKDLIYRDEIRNRNSIENRSRDMIDYEDSVLKGNSRLVEMYRYRVSLKNTGGKMVKGIVWDYQASPDEDFSEISHRQFLCTAKLKPNQSERFEGFSKLPPTRVVTASEKKFNERVIINWIGYDDGTSWQRPEWRQPDVLGQGGQGNCHPL